MAPNLQSDLKEIKKVVRDFVSFDSSNHNNNNNNNSIYLDTIKNSAKADVVVYGQ